MAKCEVQEEWTGQFIGRRYCSTHEVYWDAPVVMCPKADSSMRDHNDDSEFGPLGPILFILAVVLAAVLVVGFWWMTHGG